MASTIMEAAEGMLSYTWQPGQPMAAGGAWSALDAQTSRASRGTLALQDLRMLAQASNGSRRHQTLVVEKSGFGEGRAGAILMFGQVGRQDLR
eukprot:366036-Chlamydomonas_euryale.AAC.17